MCFNRTVHVVRETHQQVVLSLSYMGKKRKKKRHRRPPPIGVCTGRCYSRQMRENTGRNSVTATLGNYSPCLDTKPIFNSSRKRLGDHCSRVECAGRNASLSLSLSVCAVEEHLKNNNTSRTSWLFTNLGLSRYLPKLPQPAAVPSSCLHRPCTT